MCGEGYREVWVPPGRHELGVPPAPDTSPYIIYEKRMMNRYKLKRSIEIDVVVSA